MKKKTAEQKLFIYNTFAHHLSWRNFHRKFCRKHPESKVPCEAMIQSASIITTLCSTGSVMGKKKCHKNTKTVENSDDISTQLEESLMKSSVWDGKKYSSCCYNAASYYNLLPPDCEPRIQYGR
jgi:hypothetical protein